MAANAAAAAGLQQGGIGMSQGFGFAGNVRMASMSHDRQKNMMTRGPTYMMKGLRDAGINPILAAKGFNPGGTPRVPQGAPASAGQGAKMDLTAGSQNKALKASASASDALKGKLDDEAALARTQNMLAEFGFSEASASDAFYATKEGIETKAREIRNRALPATGGAMLGKELFNWWNAPENQNATENEIIRKIKELDHGTHSTRDRIR